MNTKPIHPIRPIHPILKIAWGVSFIYHLSFIICSLVLLSACSISLRSAALEQADNSTKEQMIKDK